MYLVNKMSIRQHKAGVTHANCSSLHAPHMHQSRRSTGSASVTTFVGRFEHRAVSDKRTGLSPISKAGILAASAFCNVQSVAFGSYIINKALEVAEIKALELLERMSIRDKLTVEYYLAELSHCRCTIERRTNGQTTCASVRRTHKATMCFECSTVWTWSYSCTFHPMQCMSTCAHSP